ncbi:hypothetical protein Zmor_018776 [Zophobas morio]|uniref:Uncharacterized protein n=1 Tax=Zophobas morio TaxID=2755281 RepID=A0AA38IAQ9_9CUCU|nr:hypothetical protein Zmor_018776 [Zophobas morio]
MSLATCIREFIGSIKSWELLHSSLGLAINGGRFSNSFAKMRVRIDAHAKMLFETKIRRLERDPMRIATRCAYEGLCSSEDMATAAKYRGYLTAMVGRTHAG